MNPLRTIGAPLVRSPWSAPQAAPVDARPTAPLDAVSLGEARPQTKGRSMLRPLALGLVTAASLAGVLGGALVTVTKPQAQTMMATQAVRAASAAIPEHTQSRAAMIDRMLAPLTDEVKPSAADQQKARAIVEALPTPVLQLLSANGTHVVILQPGQTPRDAGLIRPVEVSAYADGQAAERARTAVERVDRLYVNRIAALRTEVDLAPAIRQEPLRQNLERLETERLLVARRVVMEATDVLIEPADDLHVDVDGRIAPDTLRALAEQHGARTPAQVREYSALVVGLNHTPLTRILVPAFEYCEGGRYASHDLESLESWEAEDATGQYFYRGDLNAVVVRADQLQAPGDPHNVLRHELGHAFEDARRTLLPGSSYLVEREQAFGRIASTPHHPYRGTHAAEGPDEMAAETFSNVMSGNDAALRRTDAAWLSAFEAWRPPSR